MDSEKIMSNSRTKNLKLNVMIGFLVQIGMLVLSFIGRKIFLNFLSVDYLGINGLYSNILTVLSLAELGLDSAVLFSLYKPVAEGNRPLIGSLMRFFRNIYYILAGAIFAVGLLLIPFLRFIINSDLPQNDLIIYYILFLTNTVASYFVAHKVALLSAYQEQRIQKTVSLCSSFILQILHIVVLLIWKNYYIYIVATVLTTIINNIILGGIARKFHSDDFKTAETVEFDKKVIYKRISSTFLYKIGSVLVTSTDNILISILISTAAVGLYSNYYTVVAAFQGFIAIITTSLVSGIGNLSVKGDKKRQREIFNLMLLFYHLVAALGMIGFSLLFNNVIDIWLGKEYLFDKWTVVVIAFNFYLSNAISPVWMYREANGLFDKVKFLMIIRAVINIAFSVLFGLIWGVCGIFLATAISLLLTNFWYEPSILFKNVFEQSAKQYWLKQLKYFLATAVALAISYISVRYLGDNIGWLILKAVIVCAITGIAFLIVSIKSGELKTAKSILFHKKEKNK